MRRAHGDSVGNDENAALYALDALGTEESVVFEVHLGKCKRCRRLVVEYRAAAAILVHLLPMRDPPADLRTRIMNRIIALGEKGVDSF